MSKSPADSDISLNNWLANIPPDLVGQHLGMPKAAIEAFPKTNNGIVPKSV